MLDERIIQALATLFIDAKYVGGWWFWLLPPLALGIAVVYKTLKVQHVKEVPLSSLILALTILVGMAAAAAAVYLLYVIGS